MVFVMIFSKWKKKRVQLGIKCWIKEPRRIQGRVSLSTFHLIRCRNRPKPYIYPYGGMPRLQSWFFPCRHVLYPKKAPKNSFHASWSSGITNKCPNVFHYVILSISQLWNSFGTSEALFPAYLGQTQNGAMDLWLGPIFAICRLVNYGALFMLCQKYKI